MSSAIKYYGFEPLEAGKYVVGHEKARDVREQIQKLLDEHWAETETLYMDEQSNDVNFDSYEQQESAGQLVLFTARKIDTSEMVGYIVFYVYSSTHNKGVILGREDAFFISKPHRGGGLASQMLKFSEAALGELGVNYMTMSSKAPAGGPDIDKFLRRHGFSPFAIAYNKRLNG